MSLPTNLGEMSSLQTMNFHNNFIGGQIPSELGLLQSAKELILSDNLISGTLPAEIGSMAQLEVLNLEGKPMERSSISNIGGPIPPTIGNLGALRKLDRTI